MDACQVFLKAGRLSYRIKTVDLKKFTRPITEKTSTVETPAAHMGKALPLGEIKLALLKRLLGALAIFDVSIDTIPFDDVSNFISQWQAAVQMPSILPIRSAK